MSQPHYAIVIHGGAGSLRPDQISLQADSAYRTGLSHALSIGQNMLKDSATAIEVVQAVISALEDNELFNAGRGSVLTADGEVEMDASIMNGHDLSAGAVAGIRGVRNPIVLADVVRRESPHVLLSGEGALTFAQHHRLDIEPVDYFITDEKRAAFKRIQASKKGTVGAVVLDLFGDIAAGTSTGGMMMKAPGRIGDSPIIGAGTYADNRYAGVSCTGHGEFFIRYAVAHDVIARMQYGDQSLSQAAQQIIQEVLKDAGGLGGLIAISKEGEIVMEYNTAMMFRAYATPENHQVLVFDQ